MDERFIAWLVILWCCLLFYFEGIMHTRMNELKKKRIADSEDSCSLISSMGAFGYTFPPIFFYKIIGLYSIFFISILMIILILLFNIKSELIMVKIIMLTSLLINSFLMYLFVKLLIKLKIKHEKRLFEGSVWLPTIIFHFEEQPQWIWKPILFAMTIVHLFLVVRIIV